MKESSALGGDTTKPLPCQRLQKWSPCASRAIHGFYGSSLFLEGYIVYSVYTYQCIYTVIYIYIVYIYTI